jgi:hypothetical protein
VLISGSYVVDINDIQTRSTSKSKDAFVALVCSLNSRAKFLDRRKLQLLLQNPLLLVPLVYLVKDPLLAVIDFVLIFATDSAWKTPKDEDSSQSDTSGYQNQRVLPSDPHTIVTDATINELVNAIGETTIAT